MRYSVVFGVVVGLSVVGLSMDSHSYAGQEQKRAAAAECDYTQAVAGLRAVVANELRRGLIHGVSVALVDGQRTVLAEGFGLADEKKGTRCGADTVYRVGSISKLFTAIAAMQLVEQGRLDLDAPITRALPTFRIQVPFDDCGPITLRLLMGHRSGMVREAPVGGYFDYTEPTPEATVASLAACALASRPNAKTRYSNLGPTIVGQAIARVTGTSFAEYNREQVLSPLGMERSAWTMNDQLRPHLATGYMRVADGQGGFVRRPAPLFELGTIPAGNLYSTATDLARFAKMLLARGACESGRRILKPETLKTMQTSQSLGERVTFGLGFAVGEFAGHKTVRHSGAVYGFSTSIVVMPEVGVAAIVLCNEDLAMGRVVRISNAAQAAMLEAKLGQEPPAQPKPVTIDTAQLAKLAGDYESPGCWAEIRVVEGRLVANLSGQQMELTATGPLEFEAEGLQVHRSPIKLVLDADKKVTGFTALDQTFRRVAPGERRAIPEAWRGYLGSYGPEYIPLVVSERNGRLYAMTENEMDYRLTPINRYVFRFPKGLYDDEYLVFLAGPRGRTYAVDLANMRLPRREEEVRRKKGNGTESDI